MNSGAQLTSYYSVRGVRPRDGALAFRVGLSFGVKPLWRHPEVRLLEDSKYSQVDNEEGPSYYHHESIFRNNKKLVRFILNS